jgi:predicted MFS family arabinose efflux permease
MATLIRSVRFGDARGAIGPYLNVYLATERGWSLSALGVVTLVKGIAAVALQTPIGAAIDRTCFKRGAIVLALAVMAVGAIAIFLRTDFWWILVASVMIAVVGDVFYPAVAALTLGLIGRCRWSSGRGAMWPSTYAALTPLIVADLIRGTGHYNMALGAVATMTGIGASLSGLVAGVVVDAIGFDAAFLTLGLVAAIAALVFALAMPETRRDLKNDLARSG